DAFTFAIAHAEGRGADRRFTHDVMKGWSRPRTGMVDLQDIVRQICETAKRYRITKGVGDRYAAQWVRQAFQAHGVRYEDATEKVKAYLDIEPFFAQGRIEVLDHPQLIRELKTLERRPRPAGRTVVDHPRGGHDDHANALALTVMDEAQRL